MWLFPLGCFAFLAVERRPLLLFSKSQSRESDIKQPGCTSVVADLDSRRSLLHFDYGWQ